MTDRFFDWLCDEFGLNIDIRPDLDTLAILDQPAACDKHAELVRDVDDAAFIAQCQARIVANGGTVRHVTPQEHAARLKERRQ